MASMCTGVVSVCERADCDWPTMRRPGRSGGAGRRPVESRPRVRLRAAQWSARSADPCPARGACASAGRLFGSHRPEDLLHLRHVASQQRPIIADVAFQLRADCARVERRNAQLSVDGRYLLTEFGATRIRLAERLEQRIEIAATLDRRCQTIDIRVKAPRGRRRGARGDAPNRHRGSRPGRARDGGGEARASRWASSKRSR